VFYYYGSSTGPWVRVRY